MKWMINENILLIYDVGKPLIKQCKLPWSFQMRGSLSVSGYRNQQRSVRKEIPLFKAKHWQLTRIESKYHFTLDRRQISHIHTIKI